MKSESVEQFAKSCEQMGRDLGADNTMAMRYSAEVVRQKVADNFNQASTATGTPWPAHSAITVLIYGPHPLLILEGDLSSAAVGEGASGHVERVGPGLLDFGVSVDVIPYARVHQEGWPEANIPQREYLAVSEHEIDDIANALAEFGLSSLE
jgi:phage gpG-like protein